MPSETVELRGHIIDSLILPKVLDEILTRGGTFKIDEIKIGQNRVDQSYAKIAVSADSEDSLGDIMLRLRQHGAAVIERVDVHLAPAPADGVFPDDFYVTTNQQTFVRVAGQEIEASPALMDCGIAVDGKRARAVKFHEVKSGMQIVTGHKGVRVAPAERSTSRTDAFEFITSNISVEQPKSAVIRETAREFRRARAEGGKTLLVAGPAVVHTGAAEHLEKLIQGGHVDVLCAGNALAVYDIEHALFGTSLGVHLDRGSLSDRTHENQLRAINAIRRAGSIEAAVKSGVLQKGILHACVQKGVRFVLAGSIRDEGPLPEVITDAIEAQRLIREKIEGVSIALMMGTMLHSMAVASLLPAGVKTLCVDINPAAVAKLTDPRNFQALGLVTDVELFLRELARHLEAKDETAAAF
ncbi:MAG TPA: TIGR00300 family protein [Chthoniobacterales bacterium]|nr:TIGR00300 family protein [Chthoniobacterales bacterium]